MTDPTEPTRPLDLGEVLAGLGATDAVLREHSVALRRNPAVTSVTVFCEPSRSSERPAIEWFCDAELTGGVAVSWDLLICRKGAAWAVQRRVSRIDAGGSKTLLELDEVVDAEAAMIGRLTTLATELVAATGPLE
jgi:hypothetical protein